VSERARVLKCEGKWGNRVLEKGHLVDLGFWNLEFGFFFFFLILWGVNICSCGKERRRVCQCVGLRSSVIF
jgi:hypothetical protein